MILKTDDDGYLIFVSSPGELVTFEGHALLTVEGERCDGCFNHVCDFTICNGEDRADGKSVLFREIKPTELG